MQGLIAAADLDVLSHRLAVVNARLGERHCDAESLRQERREIMELIARERLGQTQQCSWSADDPPMA